MKQPQLVKIQAVENEIVLGFDDLDTFRYALFYASGRKVKERYPIKKLKAKIFIPSASNSVVIPKSKFTGNLGAISFIDVYGVETKPIGINFKNSTVNDTKR